MSLKEKLIVDKYMYINQHLKMLSQLRTTTLLFLIITHLLSVYKC